jgi:polysaccharide export outer membrane protein
MYGEVQRPGAMRLERGMTVMQALASAGGLTLRGTARGLRVSRKDASGVLREVEPVMTDQLRPDDVVFVRESVF